jgi:hypothetical protein
VQAALERVTELDVGGYRLAYGSHKHNGSSFVEITMVDGTAGSSGEPQARPEGDAPACGWLSATNHARWSAGASPNSFRRSA